MKYAKIFAVFGALALVGAGSATLLDVFGTVSGTADVKPAVKIMEVQYNPSDESSQEYVKVKNLADTRVDLVNWEIKDNDTADTLSEFNSTYTTSLASGEIAYITEDEANADVKVDTKIVRLATDNGIGSAGLANSGEVITLKHPDGVITSSIDYLEADCTESESYQRDRYDTSFGCATASIGGGN